MMQGNGGRATAEWAYFTVDSRSSIDRQPVISR
jgi:hypothetical protein